VCLNLVNGEYARLGAAYYFQAQGIRAAMSHLRQVVGEAKGRDAE
jgi:hypothetical protein